MGRLLESGGMSDNLPDCPECSGSYTYEMGALLVCPTCGHEWSPDTQPAGDGGDSGSEQEGIVDAVGNVLSDGDTVTVIRDLKVKGAGGTVKVGTKVKSIRLNPGGADGHDIDATVPGFGRMQLKSSVVKKA